MEATALQVTVSEAANCGPELTFSRAPCIPLLRIVRVCQEIQANKRSIFNVQDFPYNNGSNPTYVWANGDTTGYGLHADFANGWPRLVNGTNVLQEAIDQCNQDNGVGGNLQGRKHFTNRYRADIQTALPSCHSLTAPRASPASQRMML